MIDATKLGHVTALLMESLDRAEVEDAQLGEVMVLAEVQFKDAGEDFTYIAWRCSDEREWVQRGFLHACLDQTRIADEDDDVAE